MTRWTWIVYLVCTALILGSWVGLVGVRIGWLGWIIATGIALWSWTRRSGAVFGGRERIGPVRVAWNSEKDTRRSPQPDSGFSHEEIEAARREIHGDGN